MEIKLAVLYLAASLAILSCDGKDNPENGTAVEPAAETITVKFTADRTSMIRNPLNGWVMYMGRGWDENFGTTQGYDDLYVQELGKGVKVSDYANCAYIRTSWASLEPTEGNYVWTDPTARLTRLINEVWRRGMKISFRIVVDGRDQGQNTPQYVFDAGAAWYDDPNYLNKGRISPYPDDPVFQEKYTKFVKALAKYFDDPEKTEFVDAYGLGKWGEGHTVEYQDIRNKAAVTDWITTLYSESFKRVPLLINYHRFIGDPKTGWSTELPDSEELLDMAMNKGYSLRHDAFGMNGYYQNWEKQYCKKWNFTRPVVLEGGWVCSQHRYWIDPSGAYREGHPEDVRLGEFNAGKEAHVNMMDFRVGDETKSWFSAFNLVERFIQEGGYRLYPSEVVIPSVVGRNQEFVINSKWVNLGWGYCPNNIPQWNYKYKVAVGVLDSKGNAVQVYVDETSDPSTWLKGTIAKYSTKVSTKGLSVGAYTWVVGVVDTAENNVPGINLAVKKDKLTADGWVKVGTFTLQ